MCHYRLIQYIQFSSNVSYNYTKILILNKNINFSIILFKCMMISTFKYYNVLQYALLTNCIAIIHYV